jgi:hypothetical protein
MAKKFVSLMNHRLTERQIKDAQSFNGEELEVVELQSELVDPSASTEEVYAQAERILSNLPEEVAYVNVMGDFGMTVAIVTLLKSGNYGQVTPVYATTHRQAQEVRNPDGTITKTSVFNHVKFRAY